MKIWDACFSTVSKLDPAEEDCRKAKAMIDVAVALSQEFKLSITLEQHDMEKHIITQMRSIQGGIGMLVEHWVEKYHQVGFKYDYTFCLIHSQEQVAKVQWVREIVGSDPRLMHRKLKLKAIFKRQKKKKQVIFEHDNKLATMK